MLPIDWMTVIVSAAINTPAVGGLLGWLGKQKIAGELARQDRELESLRAKYAKELEDYRNQFENSRRLLQGHIDKTVMVTRVHFETEFDALRRSSPRRPRSACNWRACGRGSAFGLRTRLRSQSSSA